ncbi:MAG: HEAT repeat domain-containing protein [Ignavibacteriales bacterium]|nr:HEAT repeat domain-containing protein [Ignavibacteriales bacterium]
MEKNSYIGSFDSRKRNAKSIFEMVYGVRNESEPIPEFDSDCGKIEGTITIGDEKSVHPKILKKIAVLFLFEKEKVREVKISNMSLHADLDEKPLYWLEAARDNESFELLKSFYERTKTSDVKEDVIRAIGLHQASDEVFLFLKNILLSKVDDDIREESVFWIGQQENAEVVSLLTVTAQKDNSEDVREKAVFALSQVETETATDSLISLARKGKHTETRSKALFWLAEKASKKALETIKDVVYDDDEDAEIQRQALFALTQMDDHDGVEELIKIVQTHHNPKLRKEAIFWLGQSEDERAVEVLVEIVKN